MRDILKDHHPGWHATVLTEDPMVGDLLHEGLGRLSQDNEFGLALEEHDKL